MIRADLSPRELVAGQESDLTVLFVNHGPGTCSNLIFKLVLPRQIFLVGGSDRVVISSLPPGETARRTVRVRPEEPGTWIATSTNFSYRDRRGASQRVDGFAVGLVVAPAAPPPRGPELTLTLPTANLPHQTWTVVRGRIDNVGGSAAHGTTVNISGQFRIEPRDRRQVPGRIGAGQHVEFACHVRADDRGDIPVYLDVTFADESGRPGRVERTFTVSVGGTDDTRSPADSDPVRILYLAANPLDTDRTRWEQGFREIEDACRRSKNASRFHLASRFAVRDRDIGQALIDVLPHVVQFSGHGLEGGLYVESVMGRRQPVVADGLVSLFGAVAESVNCVIIGACHSTGLAQDLTRHIDHAIGMAGEIDNRSMINFSIGFYQAFAAALPVEKAFDTGRAHIAMQAHNSQDQLIPRLFTKGYSGT